MRTAVVFNPKAGPRAATTAREAVLDALAAANDTVELMDRSTHPDFELHIRENASAFDRVVVIGGDGTLSGVINGIVSSANSSLPVAFVPTGRGKDTARTLPSWTPDLLTDTRTLAGREVPVDLLRVTLADGSIRFCVNICDIGLAAHAAAIANWLPRFFRSASYVIGAVRALIPPKGFRVDLTIDDQHITLDNALMVSACNGQSFGGGVYIAPMAAVSDGNMDIVVVENANLLDLGLQLGKLKAGTLVEHRAISRWSAQSVTISPADTPWYEADGETLTSQPVHLDIVPNALTWISPT